MRLFFMCGNDAGDYGQAFRGFGHQGIAPDADGLCVQNRFILRQVPATKGVAYPIQTGWPELSG